MRTVRNGILKQYRHCQICKVLCTLHAAASSSCQLTLNIMLDAFYDCPHGVCVFCHVGLVCLRDRQAFCRVHCCDQYRNCMQSCCFRELFKHEMIVNWYLNCLQSLGQLHQHDRGHYDIKPSNIMVCFDNEAHAEKITLVDLGLSSKFTGMFLPIVFDTSVAAVPNNVCTLGQSLVCV